MQLYFLLWISGVFRQGCVLFNSTVSYSATVNIAEGKVNCYLCGITDTLVCFHVFSS